MKTATYKGLKFILFAKSIQCGGMNLYIGRKPSESDIRFITKIYQRGRDDKMKEISFEMNNERTCEVDVVNGG